MPKKIKELDCPIWDTVPAVGMTLREMKTKINELIEVINSLETQVKTLQRKNLPYGNS